MNELRDTILAKPPWSGQPVRPSIRILAWIFVFFALLGGVGAAVFIILDGGAPLVYLPIFLLVVAGELYAVLLFLHVGMKGVAPSSWLPWK